MNPPSPNQKKLHWTLRVWNRSETPGLGSGGKSRVRRCSWPRANQTKMVENWSTKNCHPFFFGEACWEESWVETKNDICWRIIRIIFQALMLLKLQLVGGINQVQKYARQNGNLPQMGVKINNIWNHHLVMLPINLMQPSKKCNFVLGKRFCL